ncbi:hypothetical protein CFOL_v3_06550, partial [Cephalotus follicularis]
LGYLSYRRGNTYVLEMYSSHRFSRQHDFVQKVLGKPNSPYSLVNASFLHGAWLSLTQVSTEAEFFIPGLCSSVDRLVDNSYLHCLKNEVLPTLNSIPCDLLVDSKRNNYLQCLAKLPNRPSNL